MPWGLAAHYGMTLHTSDYGVDRSIDMVMSALEKAKDYTETVESETGIQSNLFVRDVEELNS